jgi:hypothetical protein
MDKNIVKEKILELYEELCFHNGFGEMKVEVKILKKRQKEIIIHCGKQYRYVVDWSECEGISAGETFLE